MANSEDLKNIAYARMKTVEVLMNAKDWEMAFYVMGYVLECALKATICKTLHLDRYPENTHNKTKDGYFMTHKFDQLLTPSGLEDLFTSKGPLEMYESWSYFTNEYQGDWPTMRYDPAKLGSIKKVKVRALYDKLNKIIAVLDSAKRW